MERNAERSLPRLLLILVVLAISYGLLAVPPNGKDNAGKLTGEFFRASYSRKDAERDAELWVPSVLIILVVLVTFWRLRHDKESQD